MANTYENMTYKANLRYSKSWTDPRGLFGHNSYSNELLRVRSELVSANPNLQPEELDALTKLTLKADALKEKQHE
jgi:hypothetical protein